MIVAYAFIQHTKPMMMYISDARIASSNITHHHSPRVQEQLAGNEWQEAGYARKPQAYDGHPTNEKVNYMG